MTSTAILASFDFSVEACPQPFDAPLGYSTKMPDSSWGREREALELETPHRILIESSTHGTCYRLIRKSDDKAAPPPVLFPEARRPLAKSTAPMLERRSKIGNFQRVLVAEDHMTKRQMLTQMLDQWGFDTVTATKGAEVMKIVRQKRAPEIILLSQSLSDTDVLKLCQQLAGLQNDYSPYILLLTTQNDKQDAVHALEAGASAHLATPFEAHELRAHLLVAGRILNRQESLLNSRDQYRLLATRDALTGVWNRRSIGQILDHELDRAADAGRTTGVLLIDLDHFKQVNDTYGHLAGDFVLQEVARRLMKALRTYDAIGRYGGEEFLVVVPSTNERELCQLAQRLLGSVSKETIAVGKADIRITLSVGAGIAAPQENPSNVIAVADGSLYHAKRLGRNRFVYGGQPKEDTTEFRVLDRPSRAGPAPVHG